MPHTSTNFQLYLSFIPEPSNNNFTNAYVVPNGGQQPGHLVYGIHLRRHD